MHDPHNLGRIDLGVPPTDAVERVVDLDRMPVRRGRQDNDIGQLTEPRRVIGVELDDDLLGLVKKGGRVADPGRQVDATIGGDVGRLDDREIDPAQESLHDHLGHVREVHVHEVKTAGVGQFPKRGGRHVGRPPANGLGKAELIVTRRAGGCPAEQPDLKGSSR